MEQFDTLLAELTVREMLLYTAELKCSLSESLAKKKRRVDSLLETLALERCANTLIGDALARGISGGQVSVPAPLYIIVHMTEKLCQLHIMGIERAFPDDAQFMAPRNLLRWGSSAEDGLHLAKTPSTTNILLIGGAVSCSELRCGRFRVWTVCRRSGPTLALR